MAGRTSFGVEFDVIDYAGVKARIETAITARARLVIGYANLHGAYLAGSNEALRAFYDAADIVYADGFPLVVWRRLLWGDCRPGHRFTLSQTLPDFLDLCAARQWRIFYVGSEPHVLDRALANLRAGHAVAIEGHHGYFDKTPGSADSSRLAEAINAFGADIVMFGMGMPIQERWLMDMRDRLGAPVLYSCGAAIEYFSGYVKRPPAWVSRNGLEWAFRLANQPGKLAHRYLVEPFFLIPAVFRDIANRLSPSA